MRRLGIAFLLVTACAHQEINVAMKQRTDQLVQDTHPHHKKELKAPVRFEPTVWKPGQWVVFIAKYKGEPVVQKVTLTDRDARGYWIETETQDYKHHTISRVLYPGQPRTENEAFEIALAAGISVDGQPMTIVELTDPKNRETREKLRGEIQKVVVATDEGGRDTRSVTAGKFIHCLAYAGTYANGFVSKKIAGWAHPELPLMGLVQAQSEDGEVQLELADYNDYGGVSALNAPPPATPPPAPTPPPPPPKK